MARPRQLPPAMRALLEAGRSLAARSSGAQVAIARLDGIVDPALLPPLLRDRVAGAIEAATAHVAAPLALRDVEKLLASAWGEKPSKVLDELDPEPLAVLPHAQVHRAVLDGAPVAVAVIRPGVASATRSDLTLLDTLAGPAKAAFPALDPGALIREVRERALDELDLEHEAGVHRRVTRALRRLPGVSVAALKGEHSAESVLVTDFVEGPTLAEGPGAADPSLVARSLVRLWAGAPRELGIVLANPRANDIVLRPDGELVLLHIGAARDVEPARLEAAIDALQALRDDDAETFVTAVRRLGVLEADAARDAHRVIRALLSELLTGPVRLDMQLLAGLGERALEQLDELLAIAVRAKPAAADLWPARALGQAVAALARLGATEDWAALVLAALDEGWELR